MTRIVLFAAGFAALGTTGCAAVGVGAAAGAGVLAVQERSFGRGIDDAAASSAIKGALLRSDARVFSRVDVEVANGQALLTGVVPTEAHREAADTIARGDARVLALANEIVVGPPVGAVQAARDAWIETEVRARLVRAETVRAMDVNVETHEGVVYLLGVVRTQAEADAAAEIASRVPGVVRVVTFIEASQSLAALP